MASQSSPQSSPGNGGGIFTSCGGCRPSACCASDTSSPQCQQRQPYPQQFQGLPQQLQGPPVQLQGATLQFQEPPLQFQIPPQQFQELPQQQVFQLPDAFQQPGGFQQQFRQQSYQQQHQQRQPSSSQGCCGAPASSYDSSSSSNCCGGQSGASSSCCRTEQDERLTVKLQADQPVIPVPLYQDVLRRDKYIEIPKVELHDAFVPRVYNQDAIHDVPKMDVSYREKPIELQAHKYVDKPVEVPIYLGFKPSFVPKWDVRQVPRPIPKYYGEQEIIEVEVPQVKYVDKPVTREVVVDVQEKIVPKTVEVEKEVEVIQYEWKEKHQDIPIYKYVPKFDVELECPPPLIVPYPETKYVRDPPIYAKTPWAYHPTGQAAQGPGATYIQTAQGFAPQARGPVQYQTPQQYAGDAQGQVQIPHRDFSQHFAQTGVGAEVIGSGAYPAVTPMPSPQVDKSSSLQAYGASAALINAEKEKEKLKTKKWWFWPFCKEPPSECCKERGDTATGLARLPGSFAQHFEKGLDDVSEQKRKIHEDMFRQAEEEGAEGDARQVAAPPPGCDLEPTVEYKGAVNKPPQYGGNLEPISFKLHAIEVHQFIPLPNFELPQFVKMMPTSTQAVTAEKDQIEKLFGPVSSGWADPSVTGMPAPMMHDILQGNVHPTAPLFHQISMPGGRVGDKDRQRSQQDAYNQPFERMPSDATVVREAKQAELQQQQR